MAGGKADDDSFLGGRPACAAFALIGAAVVWGAGELDNRTVVVVVAGLIAALLVCVPTTHSSCQSPLPSFLLLVYWVP